MQVNLKTLAPKEEAKAVPLARMCIDKCICATAQYYRTIPEPDGHRGAFNQVMLRHTHLYSLPGPSLPLVAINILD